MLEEDALFYESWTWLFFCSGKDGSDPCLQTLNWLTIPEAFSSSSSHFWSLLKADWLWKTCFWWRQWRQVKTRDFFVILWSFTFFLTWIFFFTFVFFYFFFKLHFSHSRWQRVEWDWVGTGSLLNLLSNVLKCFFFNPCLFSKLVEFSYCSRPHLPRSFQFCT